MRVIIVFVLFNVTVVSAEQAVSAQTVPNLPESRSAGVAEVVNDTLYFFGGASSHYLSATRYNTVYKFDGDIWVVYDSIPDNNTLGMGSAVAGTDVYLFGGYRFGHRAVRKYDVPNKTWTYMNLSPDFTSFGSTFAYANNHIYVFQQSGRVYEYDLANDSWMEKSTNSVPGFSLSSEVYQDEIFIVGYYDDTFSHPFYKYNPVNDSWTELANLPYQVAKCAMEVIEDKIYCVGGSIQGSPMNQFDALLLYDVLTNTWSIDQFKLTSKRVWMADVTYHNKFLVLGGIDTTNNAVDIVEEIVPQGPVVGINPSEQIIQEYFLFQNYPNPFNPATNIRFRIVDFGFITLKVYDVLGKEITTLVNENLAPGSFQVKWDGRDNTGRPVASGVYFYRLAHNQRHVQSQKMLLLR